MTLSQDYPKLYDQVLVPIAQRLQGHIVELLDGMPRIDSVRARAKSPSRFLAKANAVDPAGNLKYEHPLSQIQDQIGARITVFYLSDVSKVSEAVQRYLTPIEIQNKKPDNDFEFGYFGDHYILKIPDDVILDGEEHQTPEFFELQIKTLFQHAWSECYHDLGYKSLAPLTSGQKRKAAFTAAQGWGADTVFEELAGELVYPFNDHERT